VALDDGRKAEDINPAEERPVNAAAEKVSKEKANTPYKAGDLDSIKADLPMLRPEQQEDVQRIEKRLLVDKGQGFLCTNGTGTGKTYSGLGVIKRAYDQGKKNILVVAPKAEIIKQWIEAAKTDFSLDIKQLSDTKDNGGKGICITTYANFQANRELAARDWDMIVADESHTLLENKDASETSALKMLRGEKVESRRLKVPFIRRCSCGCDMSDVPLETPMSPGQEEMLKKIQRNREYQLNSWIGSLLNREMLLEVDDPKRFFTSIGSFMAYLDTPASYLCLFEHPLRVKRGTIPVFPEPFSP
jgi:ATP:corrinoid adenosyltransferase